MFAGLDNMGKTLGVVGSMVWDSTKNVFNFVTGNWDQIKNKPLSDYMNPKPTTSKPSGGSGGTLTQQFNALPQSQKTGIIAGGVILLVLLLRR